MRNQCIFLCVMLVAQVFVIKIDAAAYSQADLDAKLFKAVEYRDVNEVDRLLEAGANVNAGGKLYLPGTTPLQRAVQLNCLQLVNLLLIKGANVNACSRVKRCVLFYVLSYGSDPVQAPAMVNRLLAAGADMQVRDVFGYTPFQVMIYNSDFKDEYAIPVAFQLLAGGFDTSFIDERGYTVAALARRLSRPALAELIESYPGRNLQERAIFSLAKKHYNVGAEAQSDIEQSVLRMAYPGEPNYNVDLFYKLIGKERPDISRAAVY